MSLTLWSHPYAAYGQKASVALCKLDLPFEQRLSDGRSWGAGEAFTLADCGAAFVRPGAGGRGPVRRPDAGAARGGLISALRAAGRRG